MAHKNVKTLMKKHEVGLSQIDDAVLSMSPEEYIVYSDNSSRHGKLVSKELKRILVKSRKMKISETIGSMSPKVGGVDVISFDVEICSRGVKVREVPLTVPRDHILVDLCMKMQPKHSQ